MVITGPYGVGKTTVIRTLSEIDVLTTERRVSIDGADELSTTVAMDFGRLTIDDELQLYLFGTPGRRRFDFVWQVLSDGMLGFIVMIDHQRVDSSAEAMDVLSWLREHADVPYVVAVNKVNPDEEERAVRQARHQLRLPPEVPVTAVDARDRESGKALLIRLFTTAREHRARRASAGARTSSSRTGG